MDDDKSIPAGWVVQVAIPASPKQESEAAMAPPGHAGECASFEYFNVAVAAADKAMEATTKHLAEGAEAKAGVMSVV